MPPASSAFAEFHLLDELTDIFRTVLDDPELIITEQTSGDDLPGWDSMTHIALIVEAECRFGISFAATEIEPLRNIGDLLRLIEMKRASG